MVLAALALAGFGRWIRHAKAVAAVAQVRDLGASAVAYASDTGELPVWHDYTRGMYWWQLIAEYEQTTDPERFHNPAHAGFDPLNVAQTISFGWNYPVIGRHKGDGSYRGDHVLRISNFTDPGATLVLADGPAENCWGFIDAQQNKPDPARYGGKAAAVFLDGSARLLDTPGDFLPESEWFKPVRPLLPR